MERQEKKKRIGILGAGAQGTLFGWHLAAAGDVTYLDVRAEVCAQIEREGVRLVGRPARKVRATMDPSELFASEVVFVFVKSYDTLRALRPLGGRLDPSTTIVSLQNGLGNEEAIKASLGSYVALVIGATTEAAIAISDGVAERIGEGRTVVGSAGASPETVEQIVNLLSVAELPIRIAYDIRSHVWGKLIANAAINPLSAILDLPSGAILSDPDAASLARAIAFESASVAHASRITLPFKDPWSYVSEIVAPTAEVRSSMALDLAASKRTEIDQINGAIVAAGRRTSTPTPYNESMLRLIKARERQNLLGDDEGDGEAVAVGKTAGKA
jgi:2-dehydropantoate 2-reductase